MLKLGSVGSSEISAEGGKDADLAYMRVYEDIERRIKSGELKSGDRLLAERALAEFYEVSYDTVRHAVKLLRDKELVKTVHGRGTFVT